MSGEKPASVDDDALAMHRQDETDGCLTSQSDEETTREGARVVLHASKCCCRDAPKKGTESENRNHARTLSEQSERHHWTLLARWFH
jgi:hypothetical protein